MAERLRYYGSRRGPGPGIAGRVTDRGQRDGGEEVPRRCPGLRGPSGLEESVGGISRNYITG